MELQQLSELSETQSQVIFQLANEASSTDGINPLSEHVALHLRQGGDKHALHFIVTNNTDRENTDRENPIIGYGHLDLSDAVEGPSAEIVVHPTARRCGVGKLLVEHLSHVAGPRLRLWSHGDLAGAGALAKSLEFKRVRVMHQLRRSLELALPSSAFPASIDLGHFELSDIDEWLDVNARSFSDHPEQRAWSRHDVEARMAEPWFDATGFLLAREGEKIQAFCWTKVHGSLTDHGHVPIGEIYVIAVDPSAQGRGLGRSMTLTGLSYLRNAGLRTAMLYVESTNEPAMSLYRGLGFADWALHVMYRR